MKPLPNRPSIEFLAREAKRIKSRHRSGDFLICRLIGHFDTSLHGLTDQQILDTRFSILDAQRVLARQYGFASWARMSRFVSLSKAGQNPSDSSLKRIVHRRHQELEALQIDMKRKNGDYKSKYEEMRKLAQDSTGFLHTAFDHHGWPGPDVIGHDCMDAIWFVAASAVYDARFQKRTLDVVSRALPDGGFWEYHYAALRDRYLTLSKQATIYGIPFGCYYDHTGIFQLYLPNVSDPLNLDKRRATAGYVSQEAHYIQLEQEAKENNWSLDSREKIISDLNQLSIDGGYSNH